MKKLIILLILIIYSLPSWTQPNITVKNTYNDFLNNRDAVLEKAIDFLIKK